MRIIKTVDFAANVQSINLGNGWLVNRSTNNMYANGFSQILFFLSLRFLMCNLTIELVYSHCLY